MPSRSMLQRTLAVLTSAVVAAGLLVGSPIQARAVDQSSCLRDGNVWVIVQVSATQTWTGCATDRSSGAAALVSAGFRIDNPSFINQINGRSYAAHTKKAHMTEIGTFDVNDNHYWMMAIKTR